MKTLITLGWIAALTAAPNALAAWTAWTSRRPEDTAIASSVDSRTTR